MATGATRQGIPEFPHLSTGMLDEQCIPAVNLHSCRGFGWFVMIPAYLLLCFIPSLRGREWGVLGSCRSHGTVVRGVFRVFGICLVAMVTSKAMLPFHAIGLSTFKTPSPKLILSMSINVAKL